MSSISQSSGNSCANQPRVIRKRVVANKRERERTKSLNQALETLRNRLPVSEAEKRSKIQTLRVAKEYIEFLANVTKLGRIEKLEKFEFIPQPENENIINNNHHHHDPVSTITTTTNSTPNESRQYECTYEKSPVKQQPDSPLTYKFYKFRLKSHSRGI